MLTINGGATLNLGGSFDATDIGTLDRQGGTVNLTGTLNNQGTTLALNATTGGIHLRGGRINGGVVSGQSLIGTDSNGTLDGVTLDTDLDLTPNNSVVTVQNNLTLNGTATIGYRARIDWPGSQTLTGTGTVVYATSEFYNRQGLRPTSNYTTFTIDSDITIRGGGGYIGYSEGWQGGATTATIINRGTIQADVSGRTIRINAVNGSFLNEGTLAATGGGTLDVDALKDSIGTASATAGGHLDIYGTFTNFLDRTLDGSTLSLSGTWTNAATLNLTNSTLNIEGTWDNDGTIDATDSTVNLAGTFEVDDLGTFQRSGGTVNLLGTLSNAGTTLDLDALNGPWRLSGGRINGGVVSGQSLIGTDSNGTLDGVTLDTDLDLTPNNSVVTVQNNLTLNGTATIGYRAQIDWPGSQTLTGTGTVVYATSEFHNRQGLRLTTNYTTFIIDSDITIRGGGGYIGYSEGWQGGSSTSTIINRGTIQADVSGRTIRINPLNGSFLNEGTLAASDGGTLDVDAIKDAVGIASATAGSHLDIEGTFTNALDRTLDGATLSLRGTWANTATLSLTNSTLNVEGTWDNNGTIDVTDSTVNLAGTFDVDDLGTFQRSGGTVNLLGTLNNAGTTLDLDALNGPWRLSGGRINGGVVSGQSLIATTTNSTLDGVTLDTDLNLTPNNSVVTVQNDLTLNGTATIGYRARIDWPGSQTLSGTGTVVYATSEFYNRQGLRTTSDYSTFIIDSDITIRGGGGYIGYSEGWQGGSSTSIIINRGTIQSDVAGRTIRINPLNGNFLNEGTVAATAGTLLITRPQANQGTIHVAAGRSLEITGDLDLGAAGTVKLEIGGTSNGEFGSISVSGGVHLGGTFDIDLVNGYDPQLGDEIEFLSFGSSPVTGAIDQSVDFAIDAARAFDLDVNGGNTLRLSVVAPGTDNQAPRTDGTNAQ